MAVSRNETRQEFEAKIEFFVDADIIAAQSMDISKNGIKFVTENPIKVCMRIDNEGKLEERYAELVWAKKDEEGHLSYGLHFVEGQGKDLPEGFITNFDEGEVW